MDEFNDKINKNQEKLKDMQVFRVDKVAQRFIEQLPQKKMSLLYFKNTKEQIG
jgi:hypothetical protein